jgi:UDP-N-acetylmuramoyl-L-alanyl-D-glutamate--2,6-diaminopimelate ligase
MEVSSHSLDQNRVAGIHFHAAVFTNLTQDHLDYHSNMEAYFQAKRRLFTDYLVRDGRAVINVDDSYGLKLATELGQSAFTFSRHGKQADVQVKGLHLDLRGTRFEAIYQGQKWEFDSPLIGALNLENLAAAVAFGFCLGLSGEDIAKGIAKVRVSGRNETFDLPSGATAVVDYAHTPDALERLLVSLRPLVSGKLVCVFGCGGDRDKGKRPLMGEIAARLADVTLVTDDNPRTEESAAIRAAIREGMGTSQQVREIGDRRAAILTVLSEVGAGDCAVIAGKGHEDYQIVGTTRFPFSDQAVIQSFVSGEKG